MLPSPTFEHYWLGEVLYRDGLEMQRAFLQARRHGSVSDALLLLEHPHVFTIGRSASRADILADPEMIGRLGAEIHETNRGGAVTYHGPGQLVGYPIFQLTGKEQDVRWLMYAMEEGQIRCLRDFGIEAGRRPGMTGVWIGDRKIGSIGVHLSHWIVSHGFALNVNTDLSYFEQIVPCGIRGLRVTSMKEEMGQPLAMHDVCDRLTAHWASVFGRSPVRRGPHADSVQVAVYRSNTDQILLLHRQSWRGAFWQIVTGMLAPGESPHQAAERELFEETGIVKRPSDLHHQHCFVIDPQLSREPSVAPRILREHAFAAGVDTTRVKIDSDEHDDFAWVASCEAIERVRFDGNRKAISLAVHSESVPQVSRC